MSIVDLAKRISTRAVPADAVTGRPARGGPDAAPHDVVRALRRKTLAMLRWFAIGGQTVSVLVAYFLLEIELPMLACLVAIAAAAIYNLIVHLTDDGAARLTEQSARQSLLFDLAQLVVMLYLTGGLANPFAVFLLAPVTIAASILSLRTTLLIAGATIASASLLAFFAPTLTRADGVELAPPQLLLVGFWVAIGIAVAFQAIYARRVANESFNMSAALGATQMALEREQKISAIGALAAAAAHELGTPLATITLVASELKSDLADREDLAEDAALIAEQARRCRDILQRLSSIQTPEDEHIRSAPIIAVIEEAAGPHRDRRAQLVMRLNGAPVSGDNPGGDQPEIARSPEFIQGLRNLIQNAVDFAASTVWIDVDATESRIVVAIGDDGAGFSDQILAQLGEPFSTTRGGAREREGYSGMGLGVFIAKTLLERTGGRLSFFNNAPRRRRAGFGETARPDSPPSPEMAEPTGAVVRVAWPREVLEAPWTRRPKSTGAPDPQRLSAQDAFDADQSAV